MKSCIHFNLASLVVFALSILAANPSQAAWQTIYDFQTHVSTLNAIPFDADCVYRISYKAIIAANSTALWPTTHRIYPSKSEVVSHTNPADHYWLALSFSDQDMNQAFLLTNPQSSKPDNTDKLVFSFNNFDNQTIATWTGMNPGEDSSGPNFYVGGVEVTPYQPGILNAALVEASCDPATLSPSTGIVAVASSPATIQIYPNPNYGQITVELPQSLGHADRLQIEVFSTDGKLVLSKSDESPSDQKIALDVNALAAGNYVVAVTHGLDRATAKFQKL